MSQTKLPTATDVFCPATIAEYGVENLDKLLRSVQSLAAQRQINKAEPDRLYAELKHCFISAGHQFAERFGAIALEHLVVELAHASRINPSVMSGPARKRYQALKAGRLVGRYAEKRCAS